MRGDHFWWGEAPEWSYNVNENAGWVHPSAWLCRSPCRAAICCVSSEISAPFDDPAAFNVRSKPKAATTLRPAARPANRPNMIRRLYSQQRLHRTCSTFGSLAPPKMGLAAPRVGPLPATLRLCSRSARPGVFDGPFLGLDLHHTRPIFQLEDLIAE